MSRYAPVRTQSAWVLVIAMVGLCAAGCGNEVSDHPFGSTTPTHIVAADEFCGTAGEPDGTRSRSVFAVDAALGRVSCDEALDVANTYLTQPRRSHLATIDDWTCSGQRHTDYINICTKDGLLIAMRASHEQR